MQVIASGDRSELTRREGKTVIGMRADFYGHCARYPDLANATEDAQVLVGPMTTDELRKAITQPAVEVGCALETGLVAREVGHTVSTGRLSDLDFEAATATRCPALTAIGWAWERPAASRPMT